MIFPTVDRIATKDVITIEKSKPLNEAINLMILSKHRDIIVTSGSEYHILYINNLISLIKDEIDLETPMTDIELPLVPQVKYNTNILDAYKIIQKEIEYICIIDEDDSLYGLVTQTDIVTNIDPEVLMENSRLEEIFRYKTFKTVSKDASVKRILEDMTDFDNDYVIVTEDSKPVGIFTNKDALNLVKTSLDLNDPVSNYMTKPVQTIESTTTIKEALEFIKNKKFKHIVIVDEDGVLKGVLRQKDLVALTYSRWSELMKNHYRELKEVNSLLEQRSEELQKMASTDQLTGLFNRSVLVNLFQKEKSKMERKAISLSIMVIDIDNFKQINDTHGHNVGDEVLKKASFILSENVRASDTVGRWGGEEFIVILPDTENKGAVTLANKLCRSFEENIFNEVNLVTVSIGVTKVQPLEDMKEVVKRADDAMYRAKKNGKNRVEFN